VEPGRQVSGGIFAMATASAQAITCQNYPHV
jgi:hypothetical protein